MEHQIKLTTTFYKCFHVKETQPFAVCFPTWQRFIPDLSKETTDTWCADTIRTADPFIQFMFIHQIYYRPKKLHRMGFIPHAQRVRCGDYSATFHNVFCICPPIRAFWDAVYTVSEMNLGFSAPKTSEVSFLDVPDDSGWLFLSPMKVPCFVNVFKPGKLFCLIGRSLTSRI